MTREQLLLGTFDEKELPHEATASMEADVAFFDDPDDGKADRVDGAIGELSGFHETFGFYAQGVRLAADRKRAPASPGMVADALGRVPAGFTSRMTRNAEPGGLVGRRAGRSDPKLSAGRSGPAVNCRLAGRST